MENLLSCFQIIRYTEELIEFRSKYHYWCLRSDRCNTDTYFLYHKHKEHHRYHRQIIESHSLLFIRKYILIHDDYVETN